MQSGDFITETWFMALLISMVSVMIFLFGAMFFVRRRQLLAKKSMTPSRSNGAVLSTPLGTKQEAPLWLDKDPLPDYSSTLPEYSKLPSDEYKRKGYLENGVITQSNGIHYHGSINLHSNPLHQNEFTRTDNLEYSSEKCFPISSKKYEDFPCMQVQEYASPNVESNKMSQVADYVEVNANVCEAARNNGGSTSPAPYATTTLVSGGKRMVKLKLKYFFNLHLYFYFCLLFILCLKHFNNFNIFLFLLLIFKNFWLCLRVLIVAFSSQFFHLFLSPLRLCSSVIVYRYHHKSSQSIYRKS